MGTSSAELEIVLRTFVQQVVKVEQRNGVTLFPLPAAMPRIPYFSLLYNASHLNAEVYGCTSG